MSNNPLWLERLNRATNYGELQAVFSDLLADAQACGESAELAGSIDEAIRRLEVERAHDEIGLQEIQSQYDTFRAANKGMAGWLKRHLPFTETRRKEHEHRDNTSGFRRVGFVPLHFTTGHKHDYKTTGEQRGLSVLIEIAIVTLLVVAACAISVVAAQHATERLTGGEL